MMKEWLKTKPMIFFEISLLCNFILGLFYQAPQMVFLLTELIKLLVGPKNVVIGSEIISIGLWLFFIYLIVEKWHIIPPDTKDIRDFTLKGIIPVGIGGIIGGLSIAGTSGNQSSTINIFGLEITHYGSSFGEFVAKFFSVGMLVLIVFNTAMILLMYITLYNHKINRDAEPEQNFIVKNQFKAQQ